MNIKSLRVFAHIMELGTLGKASEKLNLSPPAVSRLLRLLEDELETELFERLKKRLVPTQAAERLYPEALRILASIDGMQSFLGETHSGAYKPLRVICHPRVVTGLALPAIQRLAVEVPDCRIRLEVQARQNFANYVAQERFHLGIGSLPAPWSKTPSEEICATKLGVLLHVDHPLAGATSLTAEDLSDENYIALVEGTLVRQLVDSHLLRANVQWQPMHEVSLSSAASRLVEGGMGFTINERVSLGVDVPSTLKLVPLRPTSMLKIGLFQPSTEYQHPLAENLARHLRDIGTELASF